MLFPNEEYGSTYQIPFEEFYRKGYRAIIFDIDNTLVPHGLPADHRAVKLCKNLKEMGYHVCLLSNNREERVKPFAEELDVTYIYKAGKPSKKGYLKAAEMMNEELAHILFVGDQIITDVLGANRTGIYSILVAPINPKEEIQIVLKRFIEYFILFFYHRSKGYKGTRPDRKNYEANIPEEYR